MKFKMLKYNMLNLYIDESGSMTCEFCKEFPYFVIAIIKVDNPEHLKRAYKIFVRENLSLLKENDRNSKMFNSCGKFQELKGSVFNSELKHKFIDFFCRKKHFEVFYILVDNKAIEEKFYKNTARAFNYVIKLTLSTLIRKKFFKKGEVYNIQIDERNQKTGAKRSLEDYLNTQLQLDEDLTNEIHVTYFDSIKNKNIQIADVMSNLMYSQIKTKKYSEDFKKLREAGILKYIFEFPKKNSWHE